MNVLGIDPGRVKTGLAVVSPDGAIRARAIIETARLEPEIKALLLASNIERVALGDSTSSKPARAHLEAVLEGTGLIVEMVDEKNSTLEARTLYFEAYPLRGWRRLLPFLQVPPVPVDDFAAVIVARRLLESKSAS